MDLNSGIPDDICRSVTLRDLSDFSFSELSEFSYNDLSDINTIIKILNRKHNVKPLPQLIQLDHLNKSYNDKELALVLGAGVSRGCGLPEWNNLLKKLQKNINLSGDDPQNKTLLIDKIFFKLFDKNSLILARNLHSRCSPDIEAQDSILFEKFVRCALYKGTRLKSTKLLGEIVRLSSFHKCEKTLNCILTYNYDDILEYFLIKDGSAPYKSIYFSGEENNGELPIYHVHGFLPRKGNLTYKNKIILGEESYHYLYNNPNLWNNRVQFEKFVNNKCLLIGLSLNDPNLRRLLDAARKERRYEHFHHIIMLRPKLRSYEKKLKNLLNNDKFLLNDKIKEGLEFEETAEMLRKLEESFFEGDALSLGIHTIWAENEDDIGNILQQIKLKES